MVRSLLVLATLAMLNFVVSCGGKPANPNQTGANMLPPSGATIIAIAMGAATLGTAAYGSPTHVPVGTQVAWFNSDTMSHTATSPGNFDTGTINSGSYSNAVTITTAGTYNYYCTIHGQSAMSGQIISP